MFQCISIIIKINSAGSYRWKHSSAHSLRVCSILVLFCSFPQFAAFISSTVLLVVLLAVGPLFERLPRVSEGPVVYTWSVLYNQLVLNSMATV